MSKVSAGKCAQIGSGDGALGIIVGIPVAGWIFDRTGSYEWALILCALVLFTSSLLALAIRPERHHGEFVGAA